MLLSHRVEPANTSDQKGAKYLLSGIRFMYPYLKTIYVDGGFAGHPLQQWAEKEGYQVEVVRRVEPGFKILPKRWIVERTFGWFNRFRRLAKDHEYKVQNAEHMIKIAFIHLMIRKLFPKLTF